MRFYPELFQDMVERLTPILKKKDTRMRKAHSVGLKLDLTLRHLASGNDYASLEYAFRVSWSAICKFIPKVCEAIVKTYAPEYMKCPSTPDEWNEVAAKSSSMLPISFL